jgi:hypothetical protein
MLAAAQNSIPARGTNTAPPSCTTLSYLSPISLNVRPGRFKSVLYEHISQ